MISLRRTAILARTVAAGLGLQWSTMAHAQSASLDPSGLGVIVSAVDWVQGTLLGAVATSLAVIAVGATGLGMLTGRIDWRRGATVILG